MARQARKLDAFGIYAIRQTSSELRPLFLNTEDRIRFLTILKQTKMRFKFKLYAFCIKASNHYDLIIDANGSDLSKVMKSINIAYAIYANAEGKLFKDRYKSETLALPQDVVYKIEGYKKEQETCVDLKAFESERDVLDPYDVSPYQHGEIVCDECLRDVKSALLKLESIANVKNLPVQQLIKDKETRDQLILDFRRSSTLSLKELGEIFGGLSESTVCKILKDQCH